MNFIHFANALAAHFAQMSSHALFRVNVSGDAVWDKYLGAFPEGTDPIFKVRTQHNGSYDRHFVRDLGNVVAIMDNGDLVSIWDVPNLEYPYNEVCRRVGEFVTNAAIAGIFRSGESSIGHAPNVVQNADGTTHQFTHFRVPIPTRYQLGRRETEGAVCGAALARVAVFDRGLTEITPSALRTVIELIEQKVLYRGDEFESMVRAFEQLQKQFKELLNAGKRLDVFVWTKYASPVAGLRNTVIGTLLTDLSEGVDTERALKAFEQKVAPTNYKRPTAAITPQMVTSALATVKELGLEPSVERRFATVGDVRVGNVLWVDNDERRNMRGGLSELLMRGTKHSTQHLEEPSISISAEDFVQKILPTAHTVEVLFASRFQPNLMSLTAPVHEDAPPLFQWDNGFAWSYKGDVTDSIKEKVKAAGGNINAVLRVSLAWFNYDDLDLHAICPDGHVYFADKMGILDVDMNAGGGRSRTPVENLAWTRPGNGRYTIMVHQFSRRETTDLGFTLEMENDGKITQYSFPQAVRGEIPCLRFNVRNNKVQDLEVLNENLRTQGISQTCWGVTTETFVKVRMVLNSPNRWDGQRIGNKHTFFILEGCRNDEPARGIYNEFLRRELEPHRKVFEVLGNRSKCPVTPEQLSGIGFSSTKRETAVFKVSTPTTVSTYAVQF